MLEHHARVAAQSQRAIDEGAAALRLQQLANFVEQNGNVLHAALSGPRV
jgi:hypothetical protein